MYLKTIMYIETVQKVGEKAIKKRSDYRQTDRQTDRPTDRQTDRQTDRPTDRPTDIVTKLLHTSKLKDSHNRLKKDKNSKVIMDRWTIESRARD